MDRKDEVRKLAGLARIEVSETEVVQFAKEFDDILSYIGTIESLAVTREPNERPFMRNVFRKDEVTHDTGAHTEKLRDQFPDREGNSLKVKQIITHD